MEPKISVRPEQPVSGRRTSPLLYLITALLLVNVGATVWLVAEVSSAPSPIGAPAQTEPLPAYITKEVRQRIYDDVRRAYNSRDSELIWNLFSELARAQMNRKELEDSYKQLWEWFGDVEDGTYSHYEFVGKRGNMKAFNLYYVVSLTDQSKFGNKAELKIMIADDGSEYGIFGTFRKVKTQ